MITLKNSHIRIIGYSLLLISIVVFLISWLQWFIGIPSSILLIFGFIKLAQNIREDDRVITIPIRTLILIFVLVFTWVLVSGVGGAFPQKPDMNWRNAILHDLINYSWPVHYSDGFDSSLTYYIAFWMVPALFGKLTALFAGVQAGWMAANILSILYCTALVFIILLLLISHFKVATKKKILIVVAILVLFSGIDIIPFILSKLLLHSEMIGISIEWWTDLQFSSNTTQLCWVFNQAIPTWLVISLLLHEKKMNHYAFLGILLIPYAPLPFIGVIVLILSEAVNRLLHAWKQKQVKSQIFQLLSIPNIMALVTIFPIYYLYYSSNTTASSVGFGWNAFYPGSYIEFVVFEFLILAILLWKFYYNKPYFAVSVIGLLIVPLIKYGSEQDFSMRASIPFLFILMVYTIDYLVHNSHTFVNKKIKLEKRAIIMILLLVIGTATPITEYIESYIQISKSDSHCTSIYADKFGTLDNGNLTRDNFITKNSSATFFYEYLAKREK